RGALPRRHGFPVVGSPQKGHACAHHGLGGWSRLGRSSGRDMMRRKTNNLAWALALSTMLAMLLAPAHASQSPDGQASNNLRINTFSGAYLVVDIAEADSDLASSDAFYERALAIKPSDDGLKQRVLLALVATGQFAKALSYAEQVKTVPDVERFSRVALALDAFRKQDYVKAE